MQVYQEAKEKQDLNVKSNSNPPADTAVSEPEFDITKVPL
jgi:hypothetical protein